VAAWERSDEVLYVLEQSISATHRAVRFLELFGRLGIEGTEPRLVLNRYQPRHPIAEAQIVTTLKCPIYARIPRDEKALERVQLSGEDLWKVAPNGPLARAVEELARHLTKPEAPVQPEAGLIALMTRGAIERRQTMSRSPQIIWRSIPSAIRIRLPLGGM